MHRPQGNNRRFHGAASVLVAWVFLLGCNFPSFRISCNVAGFLLHRGYQAPWKVQSQSPSLDPWGNNEESNRSIESSRPPSIGQCPVVKYFPRYRIDLSRRTRLDQAASNPFITFFTKIGEEARLGKLIQEEEGLVFLSDERDPIAAMAQLWGYADSLLRPTTSEDPTSLLVAMPYVSPTLIVNWVEIMEWLQQANLPNVAGVGIEATLLKDSNGKSQSSTTVRMRRVGNGDSSPLLLDNMEEEETINRRTQHWVKRLLVEQGICPFTKSVKKSGQGLADVGVPVASIAYHASRAIHPITLFADTFEAIQKMIQAGPSGKEGISSILLAAPAFDDDFDLWSGPIFAMLEASVVAAMAEGQIGVVCFHPKYACPDGASWPGFGHMHSVTRLEKWYQESLAALGSNHDENGGCVLSKEDIAAGGAWQRRTPHATINVLRADQLEAAEAKRSSGSLYAINIEKLVGTNGIGSEQLATDLEMERRIT